MLYALRRDPADWIPAGAFTVAQGEAAYNEYYHNTAGGGMTMYDGDISTMAGDLWAAGGFTGNYQKIRESLYALNPIPSFENSVFLSVYFKASKTFWNGGHERYLRSKL